MGVYCVQQTAEHHSWFQQNEQIVYSNGQDCRGRWEVTVGVVGVVVGGWVEEEVRYVIDMWENLEHTCAVNVSNIQSVLSCVCNAFILFQSIVLTHNSVNPDKFMVFVKP